MKKIIFTLIIILAFCATVFANDAFIAAAKKGDADLVKEYIELGVNVDFKDEGVIGIGGGRTALIHASGAGHTAVVEVLVSANADANVMDSFGNTALLLACEKGYIEIVELLINGGANINQKVHTTVIFVKSTHTPLSKAFDNNHMDILEFLLASGADINTRDEKDRTVLMKASKSGNAHMVKFLVDNGADIEAKDNSGKTAADVAPNIEILRLLKGVNTEESSISESE